MQVIATVISTQGLGYYVDIVTDGSLFIGAFYIHGGKADFIPGTGSRDILTTLRYIENALLPAPEGKTHPASKRSPEELAELYDECGRDAMEEM